MRIENWVEQIKAYPNIVIWDLFGKGNFEVEPR